eukprot:s1608_g10.t1
MDELWPPLEDGLLAHLKRTFVTPLRLDAAFDNDEECLDLLLAEFPDLLEEDALNAVAQLSIWKDAMELQFTVVFVPGDRTYDLNRVLLHLGLGTLDIDINKLVFPTSWEIGHMGVPDVSRLAEFWTAWDELLDPLFEYHFFVADTTVMEHLSELATAAENYLLFCPDRTPHLRRDDCRVVIHFVSGTQLAEALAVASQHIRALEDRAAALEASVAEIRRFLGI